MKCFRGLRAGRAGARRAGGRRGMTSLLAMLYLVLFSAMAIGFYAQTAVSSQVSAAERKLHEAQLAAEAGLSFVKYHLSALEVPHLPRDQRLEEIYMQLAGRLDGTGNLAGGNVGYDATNYRLEIPEGRDSYIRTGADGTGFKAYVEVNADNSLKVKTVGRYGGTTSGVGRGIEISFRPEQRPAPLLEFGVAGRGQVNVTGGGQIRGASDPAYGSVLVTSTSNPAVTMTGPSVISGDIYLTHALGSTSINSTSSVGGVTGAAVSSHIHKITGGGPEFPVIDTTVFRPHLTSVYSAASGNRLRNCRVPANSNPVLSYGATVDGILYVETPNVVTFSGTCAIRGVIVTQTPYTGTPATNVLKFSGQVTSHDASTLDASFGPVRDFTGASVIAPGFHVQFSGGYATMSGTIAASQLTFTGTAGGTIKGHVIGLGNQVLTVSGQGQVLLERPATPQWPAGMYFRSRYVPRTETYVERRVEEVMAAQAQGGGGGGGGLVGGVVDPAVSPPLVDDTIRLLN